MSKRAKVLHRQTFQNSNNIVELTVKTIPKDSVPKPNQTASSKQQPFVRNCALKKELEKGKGKENNNNVKKPPLLPGKAKKSGGKVTVEVSKKQNHRRHEVLSHNNTWADVLRNCSSIASDSCSEESYHNPNIRQSEVPNRTVPHYGEIWSHRPSQTPISEQSNSSELIVNQQIQSSESSQDFGPRRMNENVREPNGNSSRRGHSRGIAKIRCEPLRYAEREDLHNNEIQTTVHASQPDQHNEQTKQAKATGGNRIVSDDVNASPFGESAIQLLHQLKQRLQNKGDNEGMDIVGVVEAFITGQGSLGGVGTSNIPQIASTISPAYTSVFPTPVTNIQTSVVNAPVSATTGNIRGGNNQKKHTQFRFPDVNNPNHGAFPDDHLQSELHKSEQQPQSLPTHLDNQAEMQFHIHKAHSVDEFPVRLNEQRNPDNIDALKREIARQQKVLASKEEDLMQLQTLSMRLLVNQEKLRSQENDLPTQNNSIETRRAARTQGCQTEENSRDEKPTRDWESDGRNSRSTFIHLQTENETLRKELRRLRGITMDLQTQLTKAYGELDSERQSNSRLSVLSSSKFSGSAPNLDALRHSFREPVPERLPPVTPASNLGESEVDSAYEEKTSSRLTSKVNSPHSDIKEGQQQVALTGTHSNIYPRGFGRQNQEITVPSIRNVTNFSEQLPNQQSALPSIYDSSNLMSHSISVSKSNQDFPSSHKPSDVEAQIRGYPGPLQTVNTVTQVDNQMTTAMISKLNRDNAMFVNDIDCKPGRVLDDPVYPSFSTAGEESHENTLINQNSFLQGLDISRFTDQHNSGVGVKNPTKDSMQYIKDTPRFSDQLDSVIGVKNPTKSSIQSVREFQNPTMESTRVNIQIFPEESRSSSVYGPLKGSRTLASGVLSTAEFS